MCRCILNQTFYSIKGLVKNATTHRHTDTQTHMCVCVCVSACIYIRAHWRTRANAWNRSIYDRNLTFVTNVTTCTQLAERHNDTRVHTHTHMCNHTHNRTEHAGTNPTPPNTRNNTYIYNSHDTYPSNHRYRVVGQKCGKHECCQNAK